MENKSEGYLEAERRIEKAIVENAMELYLGGLSLSSLPESIKKCKSVKILDLSNNGLTDFSGAAPF